MSAQHTPGPWMVGGVRGKVERQSVHSIIRYDETKKRDEEIACVWFDDKTGLGLSDARLIAAAPDLLEALRATRQRLYRALLELGSSPEFATEVCHDADAALAKAGAA